MKRSLSFTLILAMLLAAAGCGGSDTGAAGDTTAAADTEAESTEAPDLYTDLPTGDYDGMKINVISYTSGGTLGDKEYLDAELTGEAVDDALHYRNIETEERLNVDIVFNTEGTDKEAIAQFTASVMAGDNEFDMMLMKSYALGHILTNGLVRPWDGIKGINYDRPWYVKDANETYTYGNKTYALFSDVCATNISMCWVYVFNKRLADEWNVPDLYQIVRDGDWTMDKVEEITKDIWKDLNGNSERDAADQYGLYVGKWASLDACLTAHDLTVLKKDASDTPILDFYSERLTTSFDRTYELWWENPGTFVDVTAKYNNVKLFVQGQALMIPCYMQYLMEGDMRSMTDDYGVLPYPKLDKNQRDYAIYVHPRNGMMLLPKTLDAKKADMIGDFAEVWSAYSYKHLRPAMYDVTLTAKAARDAESVEMMDLIMESRAYDFMSALQFGSSSFPLTNAETYRNLIGSGQRDITSFYNTKKEAAEAYLERLRTALTEAAS